jgi:endonuclease/exonuclease/phosphatase family metal-dependent hydrolase
MTKLREVLKDENLISQIKQIMREAVGEDKEKPKIEYGDFNMGVRERGEIEGYNQRGAEMRGRIEKL